jgi:hypothetical protein
MSLLNPSIRFPLDAHTFHLLPTQVQLFHKRFKQVTNAFSNPHTHTHTHTQCSNRSARIRIERVGRRWVDKPNVFSIPNSNEGTAQAGWSELALRARATSVVPTAVLYAAHTILTRGRSVPGRSHIWVNGKAEGVLRYVDSPAHQPHTAHLVSGRAQPDADVAGLLLSSNPLPAFMGHVPYWWPSADTPGYDRLPNSIAGPEAIAYWRDVCGALCNRRHDDDTEMIEVDLRPGLFEGDNTNNNPSSCKCYQYADLANTARDAGYGASHEAPNDIALANFLRTSKLVNNYMGTGAHDAGVLYRQYVNIYATHRQSWDFYFDEESQSSIFHKLALEPGYFVDMDAIVGHANTFVDMTNVGDLNSCLRECSKIEHRLERQFMKTVVFEHHNLVRDRRCMCATEDWLDVPNDIHLVHDPAIRNRLVYRVKYCPGVAGGSERSVVYYKGSTHAGGARTCYGMPVGAGMVLDEGSIFLSRDASDDTRPIDLQCRAACDNNTNCAIAHSMVRAQDPKPNHPFARLTRHAPLRLGRSRRTRSTTWYAHWGRGLGLALAKSFGLAFYPCPRRNHTRRTTCLLPRIHRGRLGLRRPTYRLCPPCLLTSHPTASAGYERGALSITAHGPKAPTKDPTRSSTSTAGLAPPATGFARRFTRR